MRSGRKGEKGEGEDEGEKKEAVRKGRERVDIKGERGGRGRERGGCRNGQREKDVEGERKLQDMGERGAQERRMV